MVLPPLQILSDRNRVLQLDSSDELLIKKDRRRSISRCQSGEFKPKHIRCSEVSEQHYYSSLEKVQIVKYGFEIELLSDALTMNLCSFPKKWFGLKYQGGKTSFPDGLLKSNTLKENRTSSQTYLQRLPTVLALVPAFDLISFICPKT